MAMTELDPRIQAMFDENLAKTQRMTTEITAELKADQDRLAAEAKQREEKLQSQQAEVAKSAEDIGKQDEKPQRKPQWERPDRGAGELAFGPEDDDDDGFTAPPAPPPPPVTPPPPARPAHRRPAPVEDDDDDLSGQTWLR